MTKETENVDFKKKPTRVKAIRFGGGAAQAAEVIRWLSKWDFDVTYEAPQGLREERIVAYAPGDFETQYIYKNQWIIWYPKPEDGSNTFAEVLDDTEFKARFEK